MQLFAEWRDKYITTVQHTRVNLREWLNSLNWFCLPNDFLNKPTEKIIESITLTTVWLHLTSRRETGARCDI